MNCIVVYLIILIKLSKSLENEETTWSHFYGNPSNTSSNNSIIINKLLNKCF